MRLICGDAKDILPTLEPESVDLVFTDPPYPRTYSYTFQYLADYCPRLMKRGASLVTITPHYLVEEVILMFHQKLKYRWILNMDQETGKHARMAMGIEVLWKPMLWYVKDAYPMGRGFLRDKVSIRGKAGQEKRKHKWEQDPDWCMYYIERLCPPNGTVLDPYVGSGTTALACKKLGLNFIGIDIDENAIATTIKTI